MPIRTFFTTVHSLRLLGYYPEAMQEIEQALAIDPQNTEYIKGKAFILFHTKKYQEALSCFNSVLKTNPQDR